MWCKVAATPSRLYFVCLTVKLLHDSNQGCNPPSYTIPSIHHTSFFIPVQSRGGEETSGKTWLYLCVQQRGCRQQRSLRGGFGEGVSEIQMFFFFFCLFKSMHGHSLFHLRVSLFSNSSQHLSSVWFNLQHPLIHECAFVQMCVTN